jgi:hypothetical protein
VLKEEGKIMGQRLTGVGRGGTASRLAILAAAAGIPALTSYLTAPEQ